MIQLERRAEGLTAIAAAQRLLSSDLRGNSDGYHRAVGEAVADMLAHEPFHGRRCVSCLPAASVQYKNLRLPRMPAEELPTAVEWEARDRLQLGSDPLAIQFYDAGEVRQGDEVRQEVILLAASQRSVERHTQALINAGLQPAAIDVAPSALRRCLNTLAAHDPAASESAASRPTNVIIDVGYASSKVLIVREGQIVFFKLIPVGGQAFDEAIAEAMQTPAVEAAQFRRRLMQGEVDPRSRERVVAELRSALRAPVLELGRELGLCLRYYSVTFRGRRPDEAMLVGGEAHTPELAEMLGECAGVLVRPVDPLAGVDVSKVETTVGGLPSRAGWATVVGLSLREQTPTLAGPIQALKQSRKGVAA